MQHSGVEKKAFVISQSGAERERERERMTHSSVTASSTRGTCWRDRSRQRELPKLSRSANSWQKEMQFENRMKGTSNTAEAPSSAGISYLAASQHQTPHAAASHPFFSYCIYIKIARDARILRYSHIKRHARRRSLISCSKRPHGLFVRADDTSTRTKKESRLGLEYALSKKRREPTYGHGSRWRTCRNSK